MKKFELMGGNVGVRVAISKRAGYINSIHQVVAVAHKHAFLAFDPGKRRDSHTAHIFRPGNRDFFPGKGIGTMKMAYKLNF